MEQVSEFPRFARLYMLLFFIVLFFVTITPESPPYHWGVSVSPVASWKPIQQGAILDCAIDFSVQEEDKV